MYIEALVLWIWHAHWSIGRLVLDFVNLVTYVFKEGSIPELDFIFLY